MRGILPALVFAACHLVQSWPVTFNHSDADLVTTGLNRQFFYPRCLLFESCDVRLQKAALEYFAAPAPVPAPGSGHTGGAGRNASASLEQRMQGHPLLRLELNTSMLHSALLSLPPTHPRYLAELGEEGHTFRAIFLSQGERRGDLPAWYREQMQDLLFLAYKEAPPLHETTTIYFPHSAFYTGRLMLYVAARLLEQAQGWVYDYFLFLDDDVGIESGSVAAFEAHLKAWQPAVAGPLFGTHTPGLAAVASTPHFDHLFIAYHREAVDVLFPWVTEFNGHCQWHSELLQILEQSFAYRNHLLLLPSLRVLDLKHRGYERKCNFGGIFQHHKSTASPKLRGCMPPYFHATGIAMYSMAGEPRRKEHAYNNFEHLFNKTSPLCASWNPHATDCCTVDAQRGSDSGPGNPELPKPNVTDGWLMQCADQRTVYLIQNQTRREFENGAVFLRMGFDFDDVKKIQKDRCEADLYLVPEGDTIN